MSMPFTFLDAPSLMGSWPITPTYGLSGPTVLPRTLLYKARLLGTKKETVAGFDVVGRSFNLELDTGTYNVAFLGGATLTLQEVVDQINTAVGTEVAFLDNGFLLLESPTDGEASYVVVWADPASTPTDVLWNLGLLPGIRITGGSPRPPSTSEPSRQIIGHQHLSVALGEAYSAEAINRSLFQLAVNTDLDHGLVTRKSQAKAIDSSVVNPGSGFTITDDVYTGPVSSPDEDELERIVVLLDQEGNEVVKEDWTALSSSLSLDLWYDTNSGKQWVSSNSGAIFSSAQQTDPIYIRSNNVALGALQGVPLKIMLFSTTTQVAVLNTNPATGDRVQIGTALSHVVISDGELLEAVPTHVRATGLWTDSGMAQRVENTQFTKAVKLVTRVEGNNRLMCAGALFDLSNVAVGDLVYLTGHSITSPYSNNGTYRVSQLLGRDTLELVSDSFGPVFLNPNGFLGTITIKSDGLFYPSPYVSLNTAVPAGTYQLIYKQRSTLSDILNDVDALGGGDFSRYYNETDSLVEETLMKVLGPSATSFYDYTHDDDRISLESLEYRIDLEHDDVGRHTTIRPDYIEMGKGENARELESIWLYAHPDEDYGGAGEDNSKFVVSQSDGSVVFSAAASGWVQALDPIAGASCYMYPLGAEMGIDGDPMGYSAVQLRADSSGGNPMVRAYRMDGDVECMLLSQSSYSADHVARYYAYSEGDDGLAELWLAGAHDFNSSTLDSGLGAASIHLTGGTSFAFPVEYSLNLRPQLRLLKLDCVNRGDGGSINALTAWVNDSDGWAIGVNTVDPGYKATHASRVGKFEVSTDTEWPFVARGTSSSSSARNHFVAVRDDGGTPLSGEYLGGLAMGGRFQAGRGNVSFGYDGGCEISAIAGENWSLTNRGAHLIFRTTPVGSATPFTSAYLYRDHLSLDGGLTTYLHVGSAGFVDNRIEVQGTSVGTYSTSSLLFGDQDLTSRYMFSLRGASEGTDYRRFKLFYQSSTGVWHEVLTSKPSSYQSTLYTFGMHNDDVEVDVDGILRPHNGLMYDTPDPQRWVDEVNTGEHLMSSISAQPLLAQYVAREIYSTPTNYEIYVPPVLDHDHVWWAGVYYGLATNYDRGIVYGKVRNDPTALTAVVSPARVMTSGEGVQRVKGSCICGKYFYVLFNDTRSDGSWRFGVAKFRRSDGSFIGYTRSAVSQSTSNFLLTDGTYLYFPFTGSGYTGVSLAKWYAYPDDDTLPAAHSHVASGVTSALPHYSNVTNAFWVNASQQNLRFFATGFDGANVYLFCWDPKWGTATTPTYTGVATAASDLNTTNPRFVSASDGLYWYLFYHATTNDTFNVKKLYVSGTSVSALQSVAASASGYSTLYGMAVDNHLLYMPSGSTSSYVWALDKHDLSVAPVPQNSTTNTIACDGPLMSLDSTYQFGAVYTGTSFHRNAKYY